jgi:hypothetical protein
MTSNVKEQLIEKVRASKYYSIQLDENTDVSNIAHLLTFIRLENEKSVKEELSFCKPFLGCTTSNDIFKKLNQFMKVHGIEWKKKCVRVCSNGALAMMGKRSGVVAQIKEVAPDAKFVHCSIHHEAVAATKMLAF